jgi:co-chaperonin GroES (HSP10)
MEKKFQPTEGYLLVLPQEETSEGIVAVKESFPQLAKVLVVGKDTYYSNTDIVMKAPCKVGDLIYHSAGGFETIKHKGKEYRVVHFGKVLMVKDDADYFDFDKDFPKQSKKVLEK